MTIKDDNFVKKVKNVNKFIEKIKPQLKGVILTDDLSLGIYSTDASVYQMKPVAVVVPKTIEDVIKTHQVAHENGISILPRGAGTSLAGQTVGESVVIDFSKFLTEIIELNAKEKWVRVQPGVILSELNAYLKPHGLMYAPDPATANRANIGGIVANNSSGSHSIIFGKAIDHILEMKVALADGQTIDFSLVTRAEAKQKAQKNNAEGNIYKALDEVMTEHKALIKEKFPKVMRRVTGYSLDEFYDDDNWNLSKLISGSEGSLATILEMKINLVEIPKHRGVCIVHFDDRIEAIATVEEILGFGPAAVELLDFNVVQIAKTNPSTSAMAGFIEGDPHGLLIVEFYGDSDEAVVEKSKKLEEHLRSVGKGYAYPYFPEGEMYNNIWEVRKKGLGLLLSVKTDEKPLPFVEDACVPVKHLPAYINEIRAYLEELGNKVILYAHASVGVLHVRPVLDLRKAEDIEKFKNISDRVFDLVVKYGGSWSGEHGDGLSRGGRIPDFFGEEIYNDFVKIKKAFDPNNLMNPGKIVDVPPMVENLRYGTDYQDQKVATVYHYRKELSFGGLIHNCNGVGVCQRVSGGVMCPSYKASLEEKNSTRGRANALRLVMSGQMGEGDFTSPELTEALDLCVSCKSCKTECPSNVDVAKLKSEVQQMVYDKKGVPLRAKLVLYSDAFAKWFSGPLSSLINGVQSTKLFRKTLEKIAGIDARRFLPRYASFSLMKWYRKKYNPAATGEEVVLFADTYINFHEPHIGIAIINLLDKLNFRVHLVDTGGSKRPLISNGFLRKAKKHGSKIVEELDYFLKRNMQIIVCEPSAYSALVEDIPDLLDDVVQGENLKEHTISIEHFIANCIDAGIVKEKFKSQLTHHYIHGHCHQKAIDGMEHMEKIFSHTEGEYEIFDTGCCGMAGAFGFEKEHYDFSKKIFDTELKPALDGVPKDAIILATGFSCRHQIEDLGARRVKHWVEVIAI